jgi:hypothetical protein
MFARAHSNKRTGPCAQADAGRAVAAGIGLLPFAPADWADIVDAATIPLAFDLRGLKIKYSSNGMMNSALRSHGCRDLLVYCISGRWGDRDGGRNFPNPSRTLACPVPPAADIVGERGPLVNQARAPLPATVRALRLG